jgi:protein TonB
MKRAAEPLIFLALASAVHAGVWAGFGAGAEPGSGASGLSALTLEAGGAEIAALVAAWEAPPRAALSAEAPTLPEMPEAPAPPPAETAPAMPAFAAPPPPEAEAPPRLDTASAPPPEAPRAPPPPPRPERRSADATTQSGVGAGGGFASGGGEAGGAQALSAGALRALEAEWGAAILARIARAQRYPEGDHGSGTARVILTLARDGRLQGLSLAASSGSAALDEAALGAVRRAGRFPAAPAGLSEASYSFRVPMTFRRE